MDPFVRRLIQRLHDPSRPLSRNRHFHAFETPEGKLALKTSRRLKSLQRDILACRAEGQATRYIRQTGRDGDVRVELQMERLRGRRGSRLSPDEFDLLRELPGVVEALIAAAA